jgi:hypothetical protein
MYVQPPKVTFKPGAFEEIHAWDPSFYRDEVAVVGQVRTGVERAERLAFIGLSVLLDTLEPRSTKARRGAWNADADIVTYLGEAPTLGSEIQSTVYRMAVVCERLRDRQLHVRLLPQDRARRETLGGHNYGGSFSPNTFVLFPNWFKGRNASTIIHELFHEWYADFKVGPLGDRRIASGAADARQLARQHPSRARRNPENYEHFCLAVEPRRPVKAIPRVVKIRKGPPLISKGVDPVSKGVNKLPVSKAVSKGAKLIPKAASKAAVTARSLRERSHRPQPRKTTTTSGASTRTGSGSSPG